MFDIAAFNDLRRSGLRTLASQARKTLTEEVHELLQGVFGLQPDGSFEPVANLPAVQSLPEAAETRAQLERHLADEAAGGRTGAEAVAHLAREVAFTHLNRLVAFKLLEARKLMRGAIDRHHDSNGFKFYLADHSADKAAYDAGALPQNALDEGPRDEAYRRFLLAQCATLAREVRVLFDPDTLPSRLFPRPRALKALIDLLNAEEVRDAWQAGNEEVIGWVYQFFNEEEKAAVFDRLFKQKQKIRAEDLPAATQLFTPRWIVQYLVHNTLGRTWLDWHPDSRLTASFSYLVPLAAQSAAPSADALEPAAPQSTALARELTVLDPACGTMHFGLLAFDLLAAMYREEIERAGEPGWSDTPSVPRVEDIPAAILAHNLHGIDIDLRAVQLSALALYVKAKSLNPKATLTGSNLACADVTLLAGERLKTFVEAQALPPVFGRVLGALAARLEHAAQLGSLLRIEADMRDLIARERRAADAADLFSQAEFSDAAAGGDDFWDALEPRLLAALDAFAQSRAAAGHDERFFTGEAAKGFKLLDLLMTRYAVVVANPPYLDSRDFGAVIKSHLDEQYAIGKRNLYSAFLMRCIELAHEGGRVGMITPQSFMFLSSFNDLRETLRNDIAIESLVHTGYGTFDGIAVDCAFYTLRREGTAARRDDASGTYMRLIRVRDAEAKRILFEQALAALRYGDTHAAAFTYRQGDFDAIPSAPWVYWIVKSVHTAFTTLSPSASQVDTRAGSQTSDNFRFLRLWWEVSCRRINRNCASIDECSTANQKWYPYMKGGPCTLWYGNQEYIVNFGKNGYELKAWADPLYGNSGWSRIIKSTEYYFRRGITWTDLTQGRFSSRISPGGFIFDVSGSSAFPPEQRLLTFLGFFNSTFARYSLKLINPTVHVQPGDLARLPIPEHSSPQLDALVQRAIDLARQDSAESEITYDFVAPPAWEGGAAVRARHDELAQVETEIDEEVYRLYGIGPEDRAAIERELGDTSVNDDNGDASEASVDDQDADDPGIGVESVGASSTPSTSLAQAWLSYAVGVALGRFQPGVAGALGAGTFAPEQAAHLRALADVDGITVIEPGHPDDLTAKVRRAIELIVGEAQADALIDAGTEGKALDEWLARDLFKLHVQRYRKRPVYWLVQSPRRKYSVLLFHERLTRDSLPLIAGNRYARGRLNGLDARLAEAAARASTAPAGRERRAAEKLRDALLDERGDVLDFVERIERITGAQNERGDTVGWAPELDDGVLINLAPLRELLPAWNAEPKKCWTALSRGDYDWSHSAMRYWPDRVRAACAKNKSYAIAHGLA